MSATHRTKKERQNSADQYFTPPGLARACVRRLVEDGWVRTPETTRALEPSCGEFAWVKALLWAEFRADYITANDVNLIGGCTVDPQFAGVDIRSLEFLRADLRGPDRRGYDLICGNPPYNDVMAHLEASLEALTQTGVMAYLLPMVWFTAQGGKGGREGTRQLWLRGPGKPSYVYLVTPRPKFRVKSGSDSAAYAMVVWAPGAQRGAGFGIIDWYADREEDIRVQKEVTRAILGDTRLAS